MGCNVFNSEGMKNHVLRRLAERWIEGNGVRNAIYREFRYEGSDRGVIGIKDVMFLVHAVNDERMMRAMHVMPVACSGTLYELFVFLDGTAPKGYLSFHAGGIGEHTEGTVKIGWRDVQFAGELGSFVLDEDLKNIVAGVYVLDGDAREYYDEGGRLGACSLKGECDGFKGFTKRGLPIFTRVVRESEFTEGR
jgi:hypothetical protein